MMKQNIEAFLHDPRNLQQHQALINTMIGFRTQAIASIESQNQTGAEILHDTYEAMFTDLKLNLTGIDFHNANTVLSELSDSYNKKSYNSYTSTENAIEAIGIVKTLTHLEHYLTANYDPAVHETHCCRQFCTIS